MANRLFGRRKQVTPVDTLTEEQKGEEARRVRALEERYLTTERRLELLEQNMLVSSRQSNHELRALKEELRDVLNRFADMHEKVQRMVTLLSRMAPKEEIDVLKKELSFWDPFSFVTRSQVKALIEESGNNKTKGDKTGKV